MWFSNLRTYRLHLPWPLDAAGMEEALAKLPLREPAATEAHSVGWVPPRPGGPLVHVVNHQLLFAFGVIEKILPTAVIHQFADDKAREILENEGRKVGRRELRDLRESTALELMPRAFPRRRVTRGWLDPVNGWLVIDAGSATKAEEFLEHLRRTINIPIARVKTRLSPTGAMTSWIADGDAPANFTIDQDLNLESAEHASVRYARHSLDGDEIRQHIAAGKVATRLSMTWNERISFVLYDDFKVGRLSFLDILKEQAEQQAENEDERFDIDFALMTGEVAKLLDALVAALGGEPEPEADLLTDNDAGEVAYTTNKLNTMLAEDGATATLSAGGKTIATFYGDADPLYPEAKALVIKFQRASISLVQRHLRIGYNRAARLIEDMERNGVVSSMNTRGDRVILAGGAA